MRRRYAEYRPAVWYRPRIRILRSIGLNAWGWSALAGLALACGALGYVAGAGPWPAVVPPVVLLVVDRVRWRRLRRPRR